MRQPGEQRPWRSAEDEARPAIEDISDGAGRPSSRLGRAFGFDGSVGLDVPVGRVPDGARSRRERIVAVTGLVAVVALVGVAIVGRDRMPAFGGVPEATPLVAAASPTPRPSRTRRPSTPQPQVSLPSPIRLPTLPTEPLDGAPQPLFLAREGEDLLVLAWEPDTGRVVPAVTIPGAYDGIAPALFVEQFLPRHSAALVAGERGGEGVARLIDLDGSIRWEASFPSPNFTGAFSSDDGRFLAISVYEGTISIVRFDGDDVHEQRVEIRPPEPTPTARRTSPVFESEDWFTEVLGFSQDGRFLIVQQHHAEGSHTAMVATRNGAVETLDGLSEDIMSNLQRLPIVGPPADPVTGRTVATRSSWGPFSQLDVLEKDGTEAFSVDLPDINSWGWVGDGSLAVLTGDPYQGGRTQLVRVDRNGRHGSSLLEINEPVSAALVGARDGHVLVVFGSDRYGDGILVALVRAADGAIASTNVSMTEFDGFQPWTSGWLEDLDS